MQFITGDRQALSTARCSRAGQLATADTCYMSLENAKKIRYLCTNTTDLHKIEHDDVERFSEVRIF